MVVPDSHLSGDEVPHYQRHVGRDSRGYPVADGRGHCDGEPSTGDDCRRTIVASTLTIRFHPNTQLLLAARSTVQFAVSWLN